MRDVSEVSARFAEEFGQGPPVRAFFAPGRVNLIGDHIDYSGGLVLPAALDRGTVLLIRPREDSAIRAISLDRAGTVEADIGDTTFNPEHDWFSYVLGVVHVMAAHGVNLDHGFDLTVAGDIPDGAGLSSSASLELAVAVAINTLADGGLSPVQLALIGQQVENDYIGVACGIMDQLAVAAGRRGCAMLMDCGTLEVRYVPFPHDHLDLIVVNSNHRRSLAGSAYNDRRAAVETAAAALGIERLVDATESDVAAAGLDVEIARRARHTITEQQRVVAAAEALRVGDFEELGALMRRSHESLRDDFEVTGPYLDALAEAAWQQPGVVGARMTGAGFGGCAVVLARRGRAARVIDGILNDYRQRTGTEAEAWVVTTDDGARELPADASYVLP